MKKILMLIAAVIVMAAPAFAQNAFSDVPRDHWAYSAVSELEAAGIVQGYPDGTFQGKRTLSRYEFAMVIAKLLPFLDDKGEINLSGFATKKDLDSYLKISDVKTPDLSGFATKADLDAIAKLANEFKSELTSLGVDVNSLNADVNALRTRVSALEDEAARVKVTGTASFFVTDAFASDDADAVINRDRVASQDGTQGVTFVKDFQLNVKGKVTNNINAYLSLVAGDYFTTDETLSVIPYYAYATINNAKYGNFTFGRLPFQLNKYVFARYDENTYADVARMDDGNYSVEGANYDVKLGSLDARAWFVKPEYEMFNDITLSTIGYRGYADGSNMTNSYGLDNTIKAMYGAEIGFNIANARIAGLFSESEALGTKQISDIYGGTVVAPLGSFAFNGGWFLQDTNDYTYGVDKPTLWDANLGFKEGKLAIGGGYREVEAGYAAPGNWEQDMAYVVNPDNVKGYNGYASYDFGKFGVYGNYKNYDVKDAAYDYYASRVDTLEYWNAGVTFGVGNFGNIDLKYEDLNNRGDKSNYITASWLKKLGNASFKVSYQYVDNKDIIEGSSSYENKGHVITGQAGLSF